MLQKKIEEIVSNKYFSKDKKREYFSNFNSSIRVETNLPSRFIQGGSRNTEI